MKDAATNAVRTVQGTIERYISQPRDDGYAIISIRTPTGRAKICGKGLSGLQAGQVVEATGAWKTHPRFGEQFQVSDLREIVPETGEALTRWLVQTSIPGIGEGTARRLVATFGNRTIESIAVGDATARMLLGDRFPAAQQAMIANRAEAAFGPALREYDISPSLRAKIFAKYGLQTARTIEDDPYQLIIDIDGIPFATADRIANATGIDLTGRSRLIAAAVDALRTAANDGHTALDREALAAAVTKRTEVRGALIEALMDDIDHKSVIATVVIDADGEERDGWALRHLDRAEHTIAEKVLEKIDQPSLITPTDARFYVAEAQRLLDPTKPLNEEQRQAAEMALSSSFSIITGGPGTGKTHTLNIIEYAWRLAARDGWVKAEIVNGSPTGKAAQRMKESTGIDAATIHRLLGIDPDTGGFIHDEHDPIDAGFIAIDETSMKDVPLAAAFMRAWGNANVLLIGDPNQLASVGPGRVLGDMIDSGVIPVTRLVQVRRQAEGSAIAVGAQAICEGRMPKMEMGTDLMFIEAEDPKQIAAMIAKLHAAYLEDGDQVQVLTPGHQTDVGTIAVNKLLQAESGNDGDEVDIGGGYVARAGDKVIQTANDNDSEIYNGDSGRVLAVSHGGASVQLGDRTIDMGGDALGKVDLAYALSVHKSQGSEYDVVIMPLTVGHWNLLRRTLFYTGLTRAKKTCIVLGSRRALRQAISNDDGRARVTTLARRLREMAA